jgi:hypothetical protein
LFLIKKRQLFLCQFSPVWVGEVHLDLEVAQGFVLPRLLRGIGRRRATEIQRCGTWDVVVLSVMWRPFTTGFGANEWRVRDDST